MNWFYLCIYFEDQILYQNIDIVFIPNQLNSCLLNEDYSKLSKERFNCCRNNMSLRITLILFNKEHQWYYIMIKLNAILCKSQSYIYIIGFFNFQFLVTHVTTAITCVTRVFTLFPIYLG